MSRISLGPLTRSEAEGLPQSWLELHGVARTWDFAPALAACGWEAAKLEATQEAGEISVNSRPGATTFRVALPIQLPEPVAGFG